MPRENVNDLLAFLAVAKERSFTKAAAQLGVSQSARGHTVRGLEERAWPPAADPHHPQRRAHRGGRTPVAHRWELPRINEIRSGNGRAERAAREAVRHHPHHRTHDHAAVRPSSGRAPEQLLPDYPDIKVEIVIDYGLTDIVAERFDAGIRSGEMVAKDIGIAMRIGPDMRSAVVGAPVLLRQTDKAKDAAGSDQRHACINLRLPTYGGLYAWEFAKAGRELKSAGWRDSSCSTEPALCSTRHCPGSAWHMCLRIPVRRTSPTGGSFGCSETGVRLLRLPSVLPEPPSTHSRVRAVRQCTPLSALRQET